MGLHVIDTSWLFKLFFLGFFFFFLSLFMYHSSVSGSVDRAFIDLEDTFARME